MFASEVAEVEAAEGDAAMAEARSRALDGISRLPAQPEVDEVIEHLLGSNVRKFMDFFRSREREAEARGVRFAPVSKPATKAK